MREKKKVIKAQRQEKKKEEKEKEKDSINSKSKPVNDMICVKCIVRTKEEKYWCKHDLLVGYVLTHFLAVLLRRSVTGEDKKAHYLARPNAKDIPFDYRKTLNEVGIQHNDTLISTISYLFFIAVVVNRAKNAAEKEREQSPTPKLIPKLTPKLKKASPRPVSEETESKKNSTVILFNTSEKKNVFKALHDVPLLTVFKFFLYGELKHRPSEDELKQYVLVRESNPSKHLDLNKTISENGLKSGDFLACS